MYKVLKIGGKDYRLEYSFEASLYADCVESVSDILGSAFLTDDKELSKKERIKEMFSGIANVPKSALTMFYAGLMEAHGTHEDGDGTVPDLSTAKKLLRQYITEHKEDDAGNFYGVLMICFEQMAEDGFFDLIGLESAITPAPAKAPEVPRVHKKSTKASGK